MMLGFLEYVIGMLRILSNEVEDWEDGGFRLFPVVEWDEELGQGTTVGYAFR